MGYYGRSTGMLVWLYSRHVLLILITAYILHGLLARLGAVFRKRPDKEKR